MIVASCWPLSRPASRTHRWCPSEVDNDSGRIHDQVSLELIVAIVGANWKIPRAIWGCCRLARPVTLHTCTPLVSCRFAVAPPALWRISPVCPPSIRRRHPHGRSTRASSCTRRRGHVAPTRPIQRLRTRLSLTPHIHAARRRRTKRMSSCARQPTARHGPHREHTMPDVLTSARVARSPARLLGARRPQTPPARSSIVTRADPMMTEGMA